MIFEEKYMMSSDKKELKNNELNNKELCEEVKELSMEDLEQVTGGSVRAAAAEDVIVASVR